MKTVYELNIELKGFTGTEHYYKHWMGLTYTDGVKMMAEKAQAYWLLDVIASHQLGAIKHEGFQIWVIDCKDSKATITAYSDFSEDSKDNDKYKLLSQYITFTDFPEGLFKLYCIDGVILLPSEY